MLCLTKDKIEQAIVTYDMNILQSLPTKEPFCVSLNQRDNIDSNKHHSDFIFLTPPIMRVENPLNLLIPSLFAGRESLYAVHTGVLAFMKMA